ncbi:MAG TPA: ABC transporter permease subunit [Chthonomonadaceae bacterium]|nr:ABC transporter permease subunit [Chthonomonadaceae bacterium]
MKLRSPARRLFRPILLFCLPAAFVPGLAAAANAQSALKEIRAHKELVIATDATYPPFESIDKGKIAGFDVDIGNAIGRQIGIPVRWINLEWSGVLAALENHKCDLVMSGVTITDERKKKGYAFSRPYFLSGQAIVRRRGDAAVQSLADLKDKIVSVQMETTGQFALEKIGVPRSHILKFDTLQEGLLDVRNGKAAACVADMPALHENLRQGYSELEIVGGVFKEENLGVVARQTDSDLLEAVNRAIEQVMLDGDYARAYSTWIHEPPTTALLAELDRVKGDGTTPADKLPIGDSVATAPQAAAQPVSSFTIRWSLLREAMPRLLAGASLTLELTLFTLILGVTAGLVVALCRISPVPPLRWLATVYVEIVRGTPLLMQIYVIYFVLPVFHISLNSFVSGVMALSLNAAAYISEIFRAGIESIDSGQMEAARSLGLDYGGAMRWIILPQTLRRVLPPLTNEAVALLKDSSLVSVVALAELMRVGKEVATTSGSPTTLYLGVALLYLVMTLPLTFLVRWLERAWQPISRQQTALAGTAAAAGGVRPL